MARHSLTPFTSAFLLLLLLTIVANAIPFARSLTTVSISETSNQTLICALAIPTPGRNRQPLNCTSLQINNQTQSPYFRPDNRTLFSETVSGDGFVCGLADNPESSTSVLACWRFSAINGSDLQYKVIYDGPAVREIDAGNSHICGIVNSTNRVECWQWHEFRRGAFSASISGRNFSKISVGENFACGIERTNGSNVICVGSNGGIVGREPSGSYVGVAAGVSHACAIPAANGGLSCWGDRAAEGRREGRFVAVASGEKRSCALRENKTVDCWGEDGFALPEALRGTEFVSIEGKRRVFCGVLHSNSSLYCWGYGNGTSGSGDYSVALENVMPGPCRAESECAIGTLPGSGSYCGSGFGVCWSDCLRVESPKTPMPPLPGPAQAPAAEKDGWNGKMVASLVVGCVGCFCLVLIGSFFLFRYWKGRVCRVHDSGRLESGSQVEPGSSEPQQSSSQRERDRSGPVLEKRLSHLISLGNNGTQLEEFSLQVLLDATDNFSEDRKIGAGSFGSVYHGKLEDGREIAIKRAEATASSSFVANVVTKRQEDKDHAFVRELEFLSRLNHRNLVRLLGFYEDAKERVLVYEYMPNGSLHDHLHRPQDDTPLASWSARIKVALDAARGVQYLHDFAIPSIIHRDIKSANILLDEDWTAKVSDFGLSLMGPEDDASHLSLRAAGTVGYIDPEYFRLQKLTSKSDVYSFGVVLLELLSGHKAIHKNESGTPRNVVDYMVPYIMKDEIHRGLDRNVPPPTPPPWPLAVGFLPLVLFGVAAPVGSEAAAASSAGRLVSGSEAMEGFELEDMLEKEKWI